MHPNRTPRLSALLVGTVAAVLVAMPGSNIHAAGLSGPSNRAVDAAVGVDY